MSSLDGITRIQKSPKPKAWFCPYKNCLYQAGSERYFSSNVSLNQHLLKVHTKRDFKCGKCEKLFPNEQQKFYHEKNCGIEWKCSCNVTYKLRETLLTHARRKNHKLPDNVQPSKRKYSGVAQTDAEMHPEAAIVINVSILPSSQFPNIVMLPEDGMRKYPRILPKKILPQKFDKYTTIERPKATAGTQTEFSRKCDTGCNTKYRPVNRDRSKSERKVASTQTSRRSRLRKLHKTFTNIPIMCESRASQCSPKQHTKNVRSESIETQTENILAKVKQVLTTKLPLKKNSGLKVDVSAQSVLSYLDLLLSSRWKSRCSSETQTSPRGKSSSTPLLNNDMQTEFGMLGLLATVCQQFDENKDLDNIYSNEMEWSSSSSNQILPFVESTTEQGSEPLGLEAGSSQEFKSQWGQDIPKEKPSIVGHLDLSIPPLSTIETQTCEELDEACVHLLSNMETQTSNEDELLFPELEISDTQTQTPWPDIMDLCCNLGQLSAEIQTDITGPDLPLGDWTEEEEQTSIFQDTETQTQDPLLPMLQLTSSYTQTLDEMCDYFGFQEKS